MRAKGAARRQDVARAADVQDEVVRFAIIRRSRPIVAVAADTAQTAVAVVAITRSRIPDGLVRAKLVGEVHTFVVAVVSYINFRR